MSILETLGFIFGLACVYLVVKKSVWNFKLYFFRYLVLARPLVVGHESARRVYRAFDLGLDRMGARRR